jgi:hypothetical protein
VRRRNLLAIDVPGHPDDQEIGVELLGAGIGERPGICSRGGLDEFFRLFARTWC